MPTAVAPTRAAVLGLLAASAAALAAAPAMMPASYSWVAHTTSESAAQGVDGAWVARLGLALFGLAVCWLAAGARRRWGPGQAALHAAFGVLMLAAAAFSARAWWPGAPFDATEDLLHSIAATAMGFAFALGVAAGALRRVRAGAAVRARDLVAVAASVAIPLGMAALPAAAGVLQRGMFVVAYAWYAAEVPAAPVGARPEHRSDEATPSRADPTATTGSSA